MLKICNLFRSYLHLILLEILSLIHFEFFLSNMFIVFRSGIWWRTCKEFSSTRQSKPSYNTFISPVVGLCFNILPSFSCDVNFFKQTLAIKLVDICTSRKIYEHMYFSHAMSFHQLWQSSRTKNKTFLQQLERIEFTILFFFIFMVIFY